MAAAGAKAGGVQLMMLVALDRDQILDAPVIEVMLHEIVT